jgi:hypothetical protein
MLRFLRYLRIAFSATCLIACLLVIALWVRSYWWQDAIAGNLTKNRQAYGVSSLKGRIRTLLVVYYAQPHFEEFEWRTVDYSRFKSSTVLEMDPSWKYGVRTLRGPDTAFSVTLPLWALVVSSIAIAGAPWIRWSKRFSLRTLLIATTLVAMMLGVVVWALR